MPRSEHLNGMTCEEADTDAREVLEDQKRYYEGILFAVIDAVKDVPTYEGTKPTRLDFLQSVRRAAAAYKDQQAARSLMKEPDHG